MSLSVEAEEKLQFMLSSVSENVKVLSEWEKSFYDDMTKRYDEYGANVHLSEKQWGVIHRMYSKVTGDVNYDR